MSNIVSIIERKTSVLEFTKQKELRKALKKEPGRQDYQTTNSIITELKTVSRGRYYEAFNTYNPDLIKNPHILHLISTFEKTLKGKEGLQEVFISDKLRLKNHLGNLDTCYRHLRVLEKAGIVRTLYIDAEKKVSYVKDNLQKSFVIDLEKARAVLSLKGEGKATRDQKKEEEKFKSLVNFKEGSKQDYARYCTLTSKYKETVPEKYVEGLLEITKKRYNIEGLQKLYAEVQKNTPEELKTKVEINPKIRNGFLKGMSCRATNSFCNTINNLKPGETEEQQYLRAKELSKKTRKEICEKYNLEELFDLVSSILRLQKSINQGKWLPSNIDCYLEILKIAFPELPEKERVSLRQALKVVVLSIYFSESTKSRVGAVKARLNEKPELKDQLLETTKYTSLEKVSERLVAAFTTYLGKTIDTEIFYIESLLMAKVAKRIQELTGYRKEVFFVYDSMYVKEGEVRLSKERIEEIIKEEFLEVVKERDNKEKYGKKEYKRIRKVNYNINKSIKWLNFRSTKKTYLKSILAQCLEEELE